MANKWLAHVKKTMKQMKAKGTYVKGKGLGQVITMAKKTWHKGGGVDSTAPSTDTTTPTSTPTMGGRRARKTKRHARK